MRKLNVNVGLVSAVMLAGLTACGGGGGGGSTGGVVLPPVVTVPVAPVSVPIVTSVPAATYKTGSREQLAFDEYNASVSHCGFGMRKQDAKLDAAAYGMANWISINHVLGHIQTPGTVGFTGAKHIDRIANAGYVSSASEEDSYATYPNQYGSGPTGITGLLNAPYHALSMLRGTIDVGVSSLDYGSNGAIITVVNLGIKSTESAQAPTAGSVRTYPCEGSVGVTSIFQGETPSPYPARNLDLLPAGSNIHIVIDVGSLLALTSATLIKVSTGANVPLLAPVVTANDPNPAYTRSNEGYVTAASPLDPLSQYQVTINGTDNGKAFSRTFKFTTGN